MFAAPIFIEPAQLIIYDFFYFFNVLRIKAKMQTRPYSYKN